MVSMRFLFIFALSITLLITTISCSDNKTNKPAGSDSTQAEPQSPETVEETTPAPVDTAPDTTLPPPADEKYLDAYTSLLIQEVRNQVASDPVASKNSVLNVEFANRIFEINYKPGKNARLTFVTHSADAFNFKLLSTKGNVQYFNAYRPKLSILDKSKSVIYSAEVRNVRQSKDRAISIIKIKDVNSNAMVHVLYVTKTGTIRTSYLPGYNYQKDLTKNSRVFLERLLDKNEVQGEFFAVITQDKNTSNASRFTLTISNDFIMYGHYRSDIPDQIPLSTDYKNAWKLFFMGSAAYKVIVDPSYRIETERDPAELTALNLDLKVQAHEKIKGKSNALPIKFFIKFN